MKKIRKYICLVFALAFLTVALGISYEIEEAELDFSFLQSVYATATDESSISTKQSSTKKDNEKNEDTSSDMLDLLARVINAEARGEPYLRASSSWCRYNE